MSLETQRALKATARLKLKHYEKDFLQKRKWVPGGATI